MSDSVWPHRQQPTRLPRPWDSSFSVHLILLHPAAISPLFSTSLTPVLLHFATCFPSWPSFFPHLCSPSTLWVTTHLLQLNSLPLHSLAPWLAMLLSCSLSTSALLVTLCPHSLPAVSCSEGQVSTFSNHWGTLCKGQHHSCPLSYGWSGSLSPRFPSGEWLVNLLLLFYSPATFKAKSISFFFLFHF